ncbi:MAG: hypothetical protein K6T61_12640 [Bryobacteraceae bacterium]|nr:hypothetical protein [Bryobacteraceae bacterium]
MKVSNSHVSSTPIDIERIVLTYSNGTTYSINGNYTNPPFAPYYRLEPNNSVIFNNCVWNWRYYRNQTIKVTVYVRQEFTPISETKITPPPVVFRITELDFNLTDTNHFVAKILNTPSSLNSINITKIKFNGVDTSFDSRILTSGTEGVFYCIFDWRNFRGQTVNITAYTKEGLTFSKFVTLPSVDLNLSVGVSDFAKTSEGIPYVNITIFNTVFSNQTVKVVDITFSVENLKVHINGELTNPVLVPNGCVLTVGSNITITCPWNWTLHSNKELTITVNTAEGFSTSETLQIPEVTP